VIALKRIISFVSQIFHRKTKWVSIYLPILIIGVFFYIVMMGNVHSPTYDVERFDRAKETIRSPITVENEVETDRKMRETILAVSDRYTIVEEITTEQLDYLEEIFAAIDTLSKEEITKEDEENGRKITELPYDEIIVQLQEALATEITDKVDDIVFLQLIQLEEKERKRGENIYINANN